MMAYIFSMFFMTPIFFVSSYLFQYYFLFCCLYFIFKYVSDFYCNISYLFGFNFISLVKNNNLILSFLIVGFMILCSLSICIGFSGSFLFWLIIYYYMLLLVFLCMNLIYFYLFFEFSLIPLMFLIIGWGYQPERLLSSLYLFFYTLFGSLPLLFVIINIYLNLNTLFFDLLFCIDFGFLMHFFVFGFFGSNIYGSFLIT